METNSAPVASTKKGGDGVTAETAPVVKHKIVLLGDQAVGKTSLITRFMYDTFDQQYQATIGIDFFSKTLHINNRATRLHVWDTAGQERFRSLIPSYIRNSAATVVVYDITSRSSFLSTFKWIDEVRAARGDDVIIALVGNKCDVQEKREVSADEAQKRADENRLIFVEVSAKTGTNVKSLFRKVAEAIPVVEICEKGTVPLGKRRDPFLLTPSQQQKDGEGAGWREGGCC
ncbi:small GTP-binding protein RAB6, putative [Trypanosoma equiperdum]|uniref:Small GTP-binding protein RAB6, putative n=3 Tax=Trypanozoon TaxID=39700 RepID=Q586J5_TRYB2|nr:small GTP-binding protein RAB6, putative [Trypanosoma brucei gambiense DAL972]XP_951525.1 small GTP-binding protein RAB6, putative [Trypanosoma brucei brucei TREU927]AAX79175.1 small GTP-binding protein RAB6, putative [Trypanosoma brucei]SCU65156.1 small GTP-binding protein RAB6, putative [Trypanosoma equiperdum]AAQ15670.1 small GTP-binding protein RAB6, putative [Trypanosoma brucei brucei TREU927]CBH09349.1 small GTP-binding protein RAB6, putative [Trypanosoma brucei gambiense DAL972]|eukprot:XP_011771655.1 small GTP-binding protein RAB6, putative [Trypanosoma brucei gambiense DAL972]